MLFVVRSIALEYHRPARFNELLQIRSRIIDARGVSLTFGQEVLNTQASEELLCCGRIKVVCVDMDTFKPRPIPQIVLTEIVGGN